jgi:hypothetical protein
MSDENKNKDGGPAFPCITDGKGGGVETPTGMSLRDYFAAMAMQGGMCKCRLALHR